MASGKTLLARLVGMGYRIIANSYSLIRWKHAQYSFDTICIHGGVELDGKICETGAHISYISHLEKEKVNKNGTNESL